MPATTTTTKDHGLGNMTLPGEDGKPAVRLPAWSAAKAAEMLRIAAKILHERDDAKYSAEIIATRAELHCSADALDAHAEAQMPRRRQRQR